MHVARWLAPLLLVAPLGCKTSATSSGAPSAADPVAAAPTAAAATAAPTEKHAAAANRDGGDAPSISPTPASSPAPPSDEALAAWAKGDHAFATALYDHVRAADGNAFFSPASVRLALAMTWAGARGETAAEMARVLGLEGDPERVGATFAAALREWASRATVEAGPNASEFEKQQAERRRETLRIVNRLWGQKGRSFLPEYLDLVRTSFAAPLETLEFQADPEGSRRTIDDWVDRETEHRIQNLLAPGSIGKDTRLVLTNAVYFKATWASEFNAALTKDGAFHTSPSASVRAKLMEQTTHVRYGETDDALVVELPYALRDMAMVVVLPRARDGLAAVERKMGADAIDRWLGALADQRVHVVLPKLRTTSSFSLAPTLAAMGMRAAFAPASADFSGMDGTRELFVSAVVHKAYVAVDEKGTEAAAATAVAMATMGLPLNEASPKEFRADHPFLFFVHDKKLGAVLFMGRIADPTR